MSETETKATSDSHKGEGGDSFHNKKFNGKLENCILWLDCARFHSFCDQELHEG